MSKAERREKAQKALDLVGLGGWQDSLPSQLSGGMRQRVGLARALAADTDVLLMDEAFSALDPLIRREMQEQLLDLQQSLGKTIIFITHDLNEAMHLGDRIAVMRDGRTVQIGTAEEILSDPANDYVAQFVADVDRTRVLTAASVMVRPTAVVPWGGPASRAAPCATRRCRRPTSSTASASCAASSATTTRSLSHVGRRPHREHRRHPARRRRSRQRRHALAELFAPAAESVLPIAVTDDKNRLVGVIPRVTLLEAMVPHAPEVTDAVEPDSDEDQPARGTAPTLEGADA
ncbi:ATP-binding cassette domain-containing protein [Oerskovia sp. M15]